MERENEENDLVAEVYSDQTQTHNSLRVMVKEYKGTAFLGSLEDRNVRGYREMLTRIRSSYKNEEKLNSFQCYRIVDADNNVNDLCSMNMNASQLSSVSVMKRERGWFVFRLTSNRAGAGHRNILSFVPHMISGLSERELIEMLSFFYTKTLSCVVALLEFSRNDLSVFSTLCSRLCKDVSLLDRVIPHDNKSRSVEEKRMFNDPKLLLFLCAILGSASLQFTQNARRADDITYTTCYSSIE